jgi:hypothetical protein
MGAAAALALTLCTSFSPIRSELAPKPEKRTLLMARSQYFYWYSYPGNVYQGWIPTQNEVYDLESQLQEDVDTNPSGGYLIANGFVLYGLPHIIWPSVQLFVHP